MYVRVRHSFSHFGKCMCIIPPTASVGHNLIRIWNNSTIQRVMLWISQPSLPSHHSTAQNDVSTILIRLWDSTQSPAVPLALLLYLWLCSVEHHDFELFSLGSAFATGKYGMCMALFLAAWHVGAYKYTLSHSVFVCFNYFCWLRLFCAMSVANEYIIRVDPDSTQGLNSTNKTHLLAQFACDLPVAFRILYKLDR